MQPNVTVTAAAASRMLCTLANVKTQLGISGSGEDTRLTTLIIAAGQMIAVAMQDVSGNLARVPWLQTYLEKRPGDGGTFLRLSNWPLQGDPASVTIGTGASPTTVTASTYSVAGPDRDRLYRVNGWNLSPRDTPVGFPIDGDRALDYNVTYTAGWVMPDQITEWSAAAQVADGQWFASTDADEPFVFQYAKYVGASTTGLTEPTWPTVEEGTVADNGHTATAYAQRLPEPLEEIAMALTVNLYSRAFEAPSHIEEEGGEGWRVKYRAAADPMSMAVRSVAAVYA